MVSAGGTGALRAGLSELSIDEVSLDGVLDKVRG